MGQIETSNQKLVAAETYGTGTCSSNAVTINAESGLITTESLTTAAEAVTELTVTNSGCVAGSIISASIVNYAGTTGIPVVYADNAGSGSFKIQVNNASSAAALNGVLKIYFTCLPALV